MGPIPPPDPTDTPNGCCHHFPSRGRPGNPSCQPDLEERPLEPSHGATSDGGKGWKGQIPVGKSGQIAGATRVSFP